MPIPARMLPLDGNGLPLRHIVAVHAIAHEIAEFLRELPDWPCDIGETDLTLCAERCAEAYIHTVSRRP